MQTRPSGGRERIARLPNRSTAPVVPRERILNAAARLFRQQGFKRTTVRDIAEVVGILSGSLFHHFHSKEEMLLEIMREAALSICIRADEVVSRSIAPDEQLHALIRLELECLLGEARRDYHAVLFLEWREVPQSVRAEFTMLQGRYAGTWRSVLEACHAAGLLRCEADAAIHVLHGAMRHTIFWFKPSGRYDVEDFGGVLARLVLERA